ncbi:MULTISPECIES: DMT family transporter [unclassified Sphingobium]|uniref:DMT family transporter n=1 Tax=unclassified Sphingobium TaxID=2611147 RepID=UPI002225AF3C|nr:MULTISPECIES: DMT family transporter [unclassified Sphingobium]MCW2396325.1 drug/metabolite transporter (DMT)-like permease [Sphingobium sp. B8D3B]MCW2419841.1 drug/metabolite transporter (DMT)-like permease [Sphingobium sp. B8D3C]
MIEGSAAAVLTGLLLALFSALASAAAHALLKSGENKLAVLAWIRCVEFVLALPFVLWIGLPPAVLWPWLLAAVVVHAIYQLVLSWSYSVSDFNAAYPIARGFVPVFTALLGMALLGDRLDGFVLTGIAVVSTGILVLASGRSISPAGFAAAAIAGLLTTCYTLVDAKGVRAAPDSLTFIAWFFLLGSFPMPAALVVRHGRNALSLMIRDRVAGLRAGVMAVVAFAPALFALGLAPVGAVAAVRESSIVFGLVLGAWMLKERLGWRRLTGGLLVMAGTLAVIAGTAFR